jgi:hypothetical protein
VSIAEHCPTPRKFSRGVLHYTCQVVYTVDHRHRAGEQETGDKIMTINTQTVENLKAAGHYFAAGALAFSLRLPMDYGCHFGMRNERASAILNFNAGWKSAQQH